MTTAAAAAASTAAAALAPASEAPCPPLQLQQRHGYRHGQRQDRHWHRSGPLLTVLLVLLAAGAASAFVFAPAGRTQLVQQRRQQSSSRPPSGRLRAFNNFFGGDKGKGTQQPSQGVENPFAPELQGRYEDGLGAKIWIYLFSGKIAKV